MATYGVGTTSIGGLTIDNPLRLEKTAVPKTAAPAPAPKPATTAAPAPKPTATTSGGSGGYTAPQPFVDPYAKWGGYAGYQRTVNDYNAQRNATFGSINDRIGNEATGFHSGLLDFIDSLRSGQRKIDASAVQNELAKRGGTAQAYSRFGDNIRSGGVMLGNKNAGTSSATEGLSRIYGELGRRDLTSVNNQYAQGLDSIAGSEADLQDQSNQGQRHLAENKIKISNAIVSDAQNAISALNAQAAGASLPDRIDIEAKKQEIKNQALSKLSSFDGELNQGIASAAPSSADANRGKAEQLFTAGVAPADSFDLTTQTPGQFEGTGPFASAMPLFNRPKKQTA